MSTIGKHRPNRRIDNQPSAPSGVASGEGSGYTAPPAPPTIPAPSSLTLATALTYSAVTPAARIDATWRNLESYELETYAVQIATDAAFAVDLQVFMTAPNQASISIDGLRCATTYYLRVRTVVGATPSDWSAAASITTPADLVPPSAVTNLAWEWLANGDLVLTWTPPISANYKDAEVRIWTSAAKTVQLRTLFGRTGATYTAAMNYQDTSNAPLAVLYVEVFSRSYGNVYGPVTLPANNPFKARPANVAGLASSWAGDAGLAGADCVLTWAAQSDALRWRLTIDGTARELAATSYTYTLATNRTEHANLADPSLSIAIVAIDGLGQTSTTPATLLATNARPPATTATIAPGFSTIGVSILASQATDFAEYILRIVKDGATVATLRTPATSAIYDLSTYGSGSYQLGVSVADVFSQVSTESLSSAVMIEPLTLGDLRADATYDDDMGSSPPTLDALKDANTASGGVSYL